jgi:uncharacterized repeat protein (TIGR03837 family)
MLRKPAAWDVFCKVVDNYGDAGVCWRLSRQLVAEHGAVVRLWIDDVAALARIWPGIDPRAAAQQCAGVEIRAWTGDAAVANAAARDVVVEAFACETPPAFVAAMAKRLPQPAWFNLEYLSAEDWVETHHMLPSPHPRLPLVKYFFFPGFTRRTGGLLREAGLLGARDTFQRDREARARWWRSIALPPPERGELRVSLFAYANPRAEELFELWAGAGRSVGCVVAEGVLDAEIAAFLGSALAAGESATRGSLRLYRIPFVSQTDYDRLLWASDFNFVRGEDSFVRAQWAGRPFIWQIYPQAGDAHRPKLAAFTSRYAEALDPGIRRPVAALFEAWNGIGESGVAWDRIEPHIERWTTGSQQWAARLADLCDLASELAERAADQL